MLRGLKRRDVDSYGAITISTPDASISAAAEQAERDAPGEGPGRPDLGASGPNRRDQSTLSWTFLTFLTIPTTITSIAIVLDSAVLVIGAMVLGPEFGPIAAICVAVVKGPRSIANRAAMSFLVGFAVAITVTTPLALIGRWLGWIGPGRSPCSSRSWSGGTSPGPGRSASPQPPPTHISRKRSPQPAV